VNAMIDQVCDAFERAWRDGRRERFETLLEQCPANDRKALLYQLVCLEIELRQTAGETPQVSDYHIRFPEDTSLIDAAFAAVVSLQSTKPPLVHDPYATTEMPADTSMSHGDTSDRQQAAGPRQIGRYTVLGELGRGGQADVFRAVHPTLPMEVAIKLTHATLEPGARDALREEAHILCDLDHPHIARVRDFDFVDGRPFMVLDFIRGRSLAQVADAEPFTPQAAARMVAKLARAIGFAHSRGVIHRDLKPENVVIGADGEPKIIDFGMSRLRTGMGGATTEADEISGTLAYMASEQAQGVTSKTDHRVDVFALGAILYRLLVGEPPYPRLPLPQLLQQVRDGKWNTAKLDAAAIPTELRETCRRAMHFDPAQRYATAEALADALSPFTADVSKETQKQSTPITKRSSAALVAALLVPLLAYGAYHFSRPPALPSSETSTGSSNATGASVSAVPESLIKSFDLIQIGNSDARAEFSGSLLEYRPPREHDDVQVFAEFSQPAYCFLVAMNPDGVKQLCYPSQSDQAQSDPITELRFPAEENAAFGLTDGAGQQAFVLITSQTPLPSYQEWSSRLEPAKWPNPDVTGNWIYNHGELTAITKANVPPETRGTIRTTKTPTPFKELCDRLRDSDQSEVRGVLFEVEPKKP
jgi:serine/threonine protein kinase